MVRALVVVVLIVVALAAPAPRPAAADTGLTAAVGSAWFPRYTDADLHAIAHERARASAACECLDHDGMRPGTAEVLALNSGYANPVSTAISGWRASPEHNAILANRSYGRIGCAAETSGGTSYFACVLAPGPLPPAPPPAPAEGLLPNTALPGG